MPLTQNATRLTTRSRATAKLDPGNSGVVEVVVLVEDPLDVVPVVGELEVAVDEELVPDPLVETLCELDVEEVEEVAEELVVVVDKDVVLPDKSKVGRIPIGTVPLMAFVVPFSF